MSHRPRAGAAGVQPPRRRSRKPRQWTKLRRRRFLEALAESCNVSKAALAAGMDRSSAYDLKDRDPEFLRGWREALERAHGELGWRLLEICNQGTIRTELSLDPQTKELKQVKVTRTDPVTAMVRLYESHKLEVAQFRMMEGLSDDDDDDVGARVRAHMDLVRERLVEHGFVVDEDDEG